MSDDPEPRAAVLFLHEPGLAESFVGGVAARLEAAGFVALAHALSPAALESDRAALAELDPRLAELGRLPGVDPERLAVLGLGRGGTLAFLLACTRRLAAAVDVEGPVLHAELSPARPTQPLELALNLEGAFLGLFAEDGAVGAEQRELLRARLEAAARPFELRLLASGPACLDPRAPGYDGWLHEALLAPVLAFFRVHLAPESD